MLQMKEYQSELTKANRRAAEDRIRKELTIICKECDHILKYYRTNIGEGYYRCSNCFRIVCLLNYK